MDAEKHVVAVPRDKIQRIKALIRVMQVRYRNGDWVKIRDLRRILGHVISISLAVPAVRLWTRALYRDLNVAEDRRLSTLYLGPRAGGELMYLPELLEDLMQASQAGEYMEERLQHTERSRCT